uniref:tyrosine-type recombinase/integrase n=1 Tax=Megasphaera sp. TaxID=2023260 RepID=UPI003079633D
DELKRVNNKFLNRQELKDCLEQLRVLNPRVALAMEFISLTGLRCGEMLALRWQDIDFKKKLLNAKKYLFLS